MTEVLYLHSEDLDGWLAPPNRPIPAARLRLLRELNGLCVAEDGVRHELRVVLNSGKPPEYLEREATRFGGGLVIGGNGACWKRPGEPVRRLTPLNDDFRRLRAALGLPEDAADVTDLSTPSGRVQVALENKRDDHGDIVLSLFPEPQWVAHRWQFRGGIDRWRLSAWLEAVVRREGLALHVAPPHADGAVDVLPYLHGRPVGKWTLPLVAAAAYPDCQVRLAHGGDAHNDLAAMQEPDVLAITAANCAATRETARERGLVVDARAWRGFPSRAAYRLLARQGWYGPLSPHVLRLLQGVPATRPLESPLTGV